MSLKSFEPKPLDVAEMFKRGWLVFRPRISLEDAARIQEEGFDPSVAGPPPQTQPLVPESKQLADVVAYVFHNFIGPVYAHPLASLLTAIEDRLDSKIFARPTELLGNGIDAVSKFFPLTAIRRGHDATPVAFYGTLYRLPHHQLCSDTRYLIHRFVLAHEAVHHYFHISPWLRSIAGDGARVNEIKKEYMAFVDRIAVPCFGPPPDIAECEADMGALFMILLKGYRTFRARRRDEVQETYKELGVGFDVGQLADLVTIYGDKLQRPRSLSEIVGHAVQRPKSWPDAIATGQLLDKTWRKAKVLADLARLHPYAWICRMIEDRFLPRKHEKRRATNVQIRIVPTDTERLTIVTEKLTLASAFDEVNHYLKNNPPHLVRFVICYPEEWDVLNIPNDRIRLFQALALLDSVERQNMVTFSAETSRKHIEHYPPQARDEALILSVVLDALVGHIDKTERFSVGQANSMSGAIADPLLLSSQWRERLLQTLRSDDEDLNTHCPPTNNIEMEQEGRLVEAMRELKADKEWFLANTSTLRRQHGHGYVAVYKRRAVACSLRRDSLAAQLRDRFGVASLFIGDLDATGQYEDDNVLIGVREPS